MFSFMGSGERSLPERSAIEEDCVVVFQVESQRVN